MEALSFAFQPTPTRTGRSSLSDEPSNWAAFAGDLVGRLTDRWALAGAPAANQYRKESRATTDADVLVEWHDEFPTLLEHAGYVVRTVFMPGDPPHLVISQRGHERIDLICPVESYQYLALDRGAPRHVLTVEEVIIHKLLAGRPRDDYDIRSILAAGNAIDEEYVEHWAIEWDVLDGWRAFGDG